MASIGLLTIELDPPMMRLLHNAMSALSHADMEETLDEVHHRLIANPRAYAFRSTCLHLEPFAELALRSIVHAARSTACGETKRVLASRTLTMAGY